MSKSNNRDSKTDKLLIDYNHSYFHFPKSDRKIIDSLIESGEIKNVTFVINPSFLEKLFPEINTYFIFIDTRRADFYEKVKEYLKNRMEILNSLWYLTGDMDFVISISTNDENYKAIRKDLKSLLAKAPKEKKDDDLVICYRINRLRKFKGKVLSDHNYDNQETITAEDKSFISCLVSNYKSEKAKNLLGSQDKIKKYLDRLKDNNIIEHFYFIRGQRKNKIRVLVLFLYASPDYYESVISKDHAINKPILDFIELQMENVDDVFYKKVDFYALAEFNDISEYHLWKDKIYQQTEYSSAVNLMSFVIEEVGVENPQAFGDFGEFDTLCKEYAPINNSVQIGYAVYNGVPDIDRSINLKLDSLKDQGMIIGYQGSGKTYTAFRFAAELLTHDVRVHFIDSTGGLNQKLKEDFPRLFSSGRVNVLEVTTNMQAELLKQSGISIYNIKPENYLAYMEKLLKQLESHPESAGRKTTDVIILEEAHILFSNSKLVAEVFSLIKHIGRKGISIWFSTQNLSHFPKKENYNLISDLKNKIIHKIDSSEVEEIAKMLYGEDNGQDRSVIHSDLKSTKPGTAFVSFYQGNQLKPIKIKIPQ
ncbi:MAG: DUF853 family protein [Bacteroidetes bacterium]|nr:DUF853 family protein [Bacteroidota bacterium]